MTFCTTDTLTSTANKQLTQNLLTHRSIIPVKHDFLWRIERGILPTLTWNEDGTYISLGYWGPGDILGYPLSKVNPYQIECLTSVEAIITPPQLWHEDIKALLYHIQQGQELISILHPKPI